MVNLIQLDNPLSLGEQDITDYLRLITKVGKAEYEVLLNPSDDSFDNLINLSVKLDSFKRRYSPDETQLTFEEVVPDSLIERFGYVFWTGLLETPDYKVNNYLVGKINKQLSLDSYNCCEDCLVVEVNSESFSGLLDFENYCGCYQPAFFAQQKLYLVKDVIDKYKETIDKVINRAVVTHLAVKQLIDNI